MTIQTAGQTFPAYRCGICGALDSNPDLLAIHELRHTTESAKCVVEAGFGDKALAEPAKCRTAGCGVYSKMPSGFCKNCDYKRKYRRSATWRKNNPKNVGGAELKLNGIAESA